MTLPNETEFQAAIVELARHLGYRHHHPPPVRLRGGRYSSQSMTSFPDETLYNVATGRGLFVEVKGPKTPMKPGQLETLAALSRVTFDREAYLWRAGEITMQEIADILAARP